MPWPRDPVSAAPMAMDIEPAPQSNWRARSIGSIAMAGVVAYGLLAILWEIVKQPLALVYGLVGLGVGYALVRAVLMAVA